jgi:hypothetical protein
MAAELDRGSSIADCGAGAGDRASPKSIGVSRSAIVVLATPACPESGDHAHGRRDCERARRSHPSSGTNSSCTVLATARRSGGDPCRPCTTYGTNPEFLVQAGRSNALTCSYIRARGRTRTDDLLFTSLVKRRCRLVTDGANVRFHWLPGWASPRRADGWL